MNVLQMMMMAFLTLAWIWQAGRKCYQMIQCPILEKGQINPQKGMVEANYTPWMEVRMEITLQREFGTFQMNFSPNLGLN